MKKGALLMVVVFSSELFAAPPANKVMSLSIEQYVKIALAQGPDATTAYNDFENETYSNKISYRLSRAPSMAASSTLTRSRVSVDGVRTYGDSTVGTLSLNQPIYPTGADLTASVSDSTTESESLGDKTLVDPKPTYSATLTQPLFLFKGNSDWRTWKRARISYIIAKENYQRKLQTLENDARAKYYEVLLKKEGLEVERIKLESSRRANAVTAALVEAGRYAGIELSRSQVKYQLDVRRLQNAEFELKRAINDAIKFAALPGDAVIEFVTKLNYTAYNLKLDTLLSTAFAHRPDYLASQRQLELSELTVRETLEENNLDLSAVATYGKSDAGPRVTGARESEAYTGTLNVTWPFFNWRITHLRAESARNDLENSRIAMAALEDTIRTEVTNAFLEIQKIEEQLDDLARSREEARRSVEVVRTRYKNGRDRLIDVFDSERDLRDLELEYLTNLVAANKAQDNFTVLIGRPLREVATR